MLFQKNATTLKAFIDDLYAWGNTSIDLGMKWGTALLDPSAQSAITALATGTDAIIPSDFSARPSEYSDGDTIKVVVLMTDGQNTSQYYVEDDHRRGQSEVWYNAEEDIYSIPKSTGSSPYYWYSSSDGGDYEDHIYGTESGEDGTSYQLSYADLWAYTSLKQNYYYHYRPWMGNSYSKNEWYYGVYDSYGTSTKNNRTNDICDAAKDAGIIVYTIGFEAPSGGQAVLQDCASSDAHYFDVSGLEITDAFASIATSIRQLRLTQ